MHRSARYAPAALALVHLLLAPPVFADQVELGNGDRISGEVQALAGGTLTLATAHGELRIPWADVVRVITDQPLMVTVADRAPVRARIGAADAGRAALEPGGVVPLADIAALALPQPPRTLDGNASIGFVQTGGNTNVNSLRLDGNLTARLGDHRYTTTAAITRAEDDRKETARNWTIGIKYDRFVTPRVFLNASTILTNDRFRDLQLRTALGAGVGYQILETARVTLTADSGLGFVNENLGGQPGDRYGAARESAALSLFLIPDRVQVFHEHDTYVGATGDDNLFVKTQNGVRFVLAAGFVTSVRHDLDYDRSPALGRRNTDRTFAVTLGYSF